MSIEGIEPAIQKPVFASIPNDFGCVSKVLNLGEPVTTLQDNNSFGDSIREMVLHGAYNEHTPPSCQLVEALA